MGNSGKKVMQLFQKRSPGGGTNLSSALAEAVTPDMLGRAETILVITDGAPNSRSNVEKEIVKASKQLCRAEDLSMSFIQVGNAKGAAEFLRFLDDDLEKKHDIFDIVDTMGAGEMAGKSFLEVVAKSVYD